MKIKIIIIVTILFFAVVIIALYLADFSQPQINWGVTFSQQYAKNELGLDWKKTYLAILDDLKVSHLRLIAYWNYNEPHDSQYNFSDLDWQINEASKRDIKIILAVGQKLPRWPECHNPDWTKNLSEKERQTRQLKFVEAVINRYKTNLNITAWQMENEPFLKMFGECPPLSQETLKKEKELVKKISDKPILITDSGELNWWIKAAQAQPDILGITLYRVVYNPKIGYFRWFIPPSFYYFKALVIKNIFHIERVIISELQAEAWHPVGTNLFEMALTEQFESMDIKQFKKNIEFAKKAGFDEAYLWGVEWWYFLKDKRGDENFWLEAKKLWQ